MTDEAHIETIITRMCEAFSRGMERRGERLETVRDLRTSQQIVIKPLGEQKRLISEALIADPTANVAFVAASIGTGTAYVYEVRKKLRKEGRI